MGKRGKTLVSSVLAVAVMLGMIAVPGLKVSAGSYYSLQIGGVGVNSDNCDDIENNHWSYDPDTDTLTLSDYEYTSDSGYAISCFDSYDHNTCRELNLVLIGENKLQTGGDSVISLGELTVKGAGSLEIKGTGASTVGIELESSSVVNAEYIQESGEVSIEAYQGIVSDKNIHIKGGVLNINTQDTGMSGGHWHDEYIKIDGGSVVINSGTVGINVLDYNCRLYINTDQVTLTGSSKAIEGTMENSVPLFGWTDKEGTEGGTELTAGKTGNYSFKKIGPAPEATISLSSLSIGVKAPEIGSLISDTTHPEFVLDDLNASVGAGNYTVSSRYYKEMPFDYGYDDPIDESAAYSTKYFYGVTITLDYDKKIGFSDDVELKVNGTKIDFDDPATFRKGSQGKYSYTFYGTVTTRDPDYISTVSVEIPNLYEGTSLNTFPECILGEPFSSMTLFADYEYSTRFVSSFPSAGSGYSVCPEGSVVAGNEYYYEVKIILKDSLEKFFPNDIKLLVNGSEVSFDSISYERGSSLNGKTLLFYGKITARPAATKYPLYIGDLQVDSDNCNNFNKNHWKYDASGNTLTIEGLELDGGLSYTGNSALNLVIQGENHLRDGISSSGPMNISGNGSITLGAGYIRCDKVITVGSGSWTIETKHDCCIYAESIYFNGGNVKIKALTQTETSYLGYLLEVRDYCDFNGGSLTIDGFNRCDGVKGFVTLSSPLSKLSVENCNTGIDGTVHVNNGTLNVENYLETFAYGVKGELVVGNSEDINVLIDCNKPVYGKLYNHIPGMAYAFINGEKEVKEPIAVLSFAYTEEDMPHGTKFQFPTERVKDVVVTVLPPECGVEMYEDGGTPSFYPVTIIDEDAQYSCSTYYISRLPSSGDGYSEFPAGMVWPGTDYYYALSFDSPIWFDKDYTLTINGKKVDVDSDPDYEVFEMPDYSAFTIYGKIKTDPNGPTPMPTLSVTPPALVIDMESDDCDIPDKEFAAALEAFDRNNDKVLIWGEVMNVTSLDVSGLGIKDLSGIEIFRNLMNLNCSNNYLMTLDLSKNTKLKTLDCSINNIATLDIDKNKELVTIDCSDNQIVDLRATKKMSNLETLICHTNRVALADFSKNANLKTLDCRDNMIQSLDLSKNANLEKLLCTDNMLTQLDISNNPNLIKAYRANDKGKFDYDEDVKIIAPEVGPSVAPTATPTTIPLPTIFVIPSITPTANPTAPDSKPTVTPAKKPTTAPAKKPTATPKASAVTLTLDKKTISVACGKTETLKATLKGSSSKITWKSSDTKVATVDATGKVTTKMAGAATITATAAGKSAKCVVTVLYKDVTSTKDFWYEPTNYLTALGVVKGYDNQTRFKPANDCTRAQMLTFMWRLSGSPLPKSSTCKFPDVKKTDYFYKPVIWAVDKGITTGYSDGTFKPQNVCTRAQTVTFLWRMAGKPKPETKTNRFKDVKSSAYYYKATLWAAEMGILAGYSDGTFRPEGLCLRRQMVTFLYKYDKYVNGKG
ncbi:MAG: S-layer homology domain-containing protein [Clostridiales bacterium]|nr:S-layer homology domain-containing protein [Clostridiales bacterium]